MASSTPLPPRRPRTARVEFQNTIDCAEPTLKPDVEKTQLYKWLKSKDVELAKRILDIRKELTKWMPCVAQFFPHYPSHGVDHSDRIIEQLSRLLFNNTKPVVQFSS